MPSVVHPDCDRDKDDEGGQVREERLYYVQNWRHDVVALIHAPSSSDMKIVERIRYDAYGRPSSQSPIDVGVSCGVTGINGSVDNNDDTVFYGSGSGEHWYNDIGSASGSACPTAREKPTTRLPTQAPVWMPATSTAALAKCAIRQVRSKTRVSSDEQVATCRSSRRELHLPKPL